jgi:hypothetical protein
MSWILIECFFYTFWMKNTDLARFNIKQEDMQKILEHMKQVQKPKVQCHEPYMVPYDIYDIPELEVSESEDNDKKIDESVETSDAVSNMKMTRSKTCVNILDI